MDWLRDAGALAKAYRAGELSPVDLVPEIRRRLDRAAALDALQWRDDERLEASMRAAEQALRAGSSRPFEGIPWTAKELLPIEGLPGLYGMEPFADRLPPGSAWIAERMASLGAVLVARTSSPELGALPTTESWRVACRNPADPARTSGGSSGGAAVCAALGVAPFNHGNDGGGSVRIPAAWCGVVGLKPSRNRISRGPFTGDGWGGLTAEGPLTHRVGDAAWFVDALAGPGPGDAVGPPPLTRALRDACADRDRRRIAVATHRDGHGVAAEVADAVRRAADWLADTGHEVVERPLPDFDALLEGFGIASLTGIASVALTAEQAATLHPRVRHLWEHGRDVPAVELIAGLEAMQRAARRIATWFDDLDALLTPTLAITAPILGSLGSDPQRAWEDFAPVLQWTWPFNATGQPAITVPAGLDADGLPIGIQLAGRIGDEATIVALASQWRDAHP